MKCPNCQYEITATQTHEISIEVCSNCGGTWFDQGELRQLKDKALPDANWMDFNIEANTEAYKLDWGERICPVCQEHLVRVEYADTGVIVDACSKHHGIYLDKGEFETILDTLEKEISSKEMPDYLRDSLKQGKDVISGKEGRHSEWQDFSTVVRLMADRFMVDHPTFARALAEFALASPK